MKGIIFILSAPSGCGKTSIAKNLVETLDNIMLSISNTTREPRDRETHGNEYYFNTNEEFLTFVKQDMLLEYAKIYGNYYGTLNAPIINAINSNIDILFDIDAQGAGIIKEKIFTKVVTIFILPPSIEHLRLRLVGRAQDSEEKINHRLSLAMDEIKSAVFYDYIVVNDDLDRALYEIRSIITAERTKNSKQEKLNLFYENN